MKKTKNSVELQGYLYSLNKSTPQRRNYNELQSTVSAAGNTYIRGRVTLATDKSMTNLCNVDFTYVAEVWPAKNGKPERPNDTYTALMTLIESGVEGRVDPANATPIRISGEFDENVYKDQEGNVREIPMIRGSFVHLDGMRPNDFATFNTDMVITKCIEREGKLGRHAQLEGFVFNFRGEAKKIDFNVREGSGVDYFMEQEISGNNPMFATVNGVFETVAIEGETSEAPEAGWGQVVKEVASVDNIRSRTVIGVVPGEFDDEATITKVELKKILTKRSEDIATDIARSDERKAANATKNISFVKEAAPVITPATDLVDVDDSEFNFDDLF